VKVNKIWERGWQ